MFFAGLEHDSGNTDHAQFRQYSNAQGRWMSMDPYAGSYDFANPQSLSRYNYALNSPVSFVDPLGLEKWVDQYGNVYEDNGNGGISGGSGGSVTVTGGDDSGPFTPVYAPVTAGFGRKVPNKTSLVKSVFCGLFSGPTNLADPQNLSSTIGVGAGGSAGFGFILGVAASAGVQVVADNQGNLGGCDQCWRKPWLWCFWRGRDRRSASDVFHC